jgi:hypothetical protein
LGSDKEKAKAKTKKVKTRKEKVVQRIKGLGDSTWRFSHPFNHAIAWLKGWGGRKEERRGEETRKNGEGEG